MPLPAMAYSWGERWGRDALSLYTAGRGIRAMPSELLPGMARGLR